MNIYVIVHQPYSGINSLIKWAHQKNHKINFINIYKANFVFPEIKEIDLLIILGGFQHPYQKNIYKYLADEVAFIKRVANENKKIIGFCLGGQLIAEALGGKIIKAPIAEYGIFEVYVNDLGKKDKIFSNLIPCFDAFHWHQYMIKLPNNAELLASSNACEIQAFKIGERIYGFQFHLELDEKDMEEIYKTKANLEQKKYKFIKNSNLNANKYKIINENLFKLLEVL